MEAIEEIMEVIEEGDMVFFTIVNGEKNIES